MKGKLTCGFQYQVPDARFKNWLFLDALVRLEKEGDDAAAIAIIDLLFGKKQKQELFNFLSKEDEDGVPILALEDVYTAFNEVVTNATESGIYSKNS